MSPDLVWFKSSYSNNEGGACVEVAYDWHKSTYSGDYEDACVEVAACPHAVHVRDSKLTGGPTFTVGADAWAAFVAGAASR
ncbi:DUF397 domain-containing protein [Streptomyces lavendulocolor]|uniref:DUF397 domain-containing protein n=1 Tax=Streptomyces lavendulocolor TaxID=67316 RepID=UPI003C2D023D